MLRKTFNLKGSTIMTILNGITKAFSLVIFMVIFSHRSYSMPDSKIFIPDSLIVTYHGWDRVTPNCVVEDDMFPSMKEEGARQYLINAFKKKLPLSVILKNESIKSIIVSQYNLSYYNYILKMCQVEKPMTAHWYNDSEMGDFVVEATSHLQGNTRSYVSMHISQYSGGLKIEAFDNNNKITTDYIKNNSQTLKNWISVSTIVNAYANVFKAEAMYLNKYVYIYTDLSTIERADGTKYKYKMSISPNNTPLGVWAHFYTNEDMFTYYDFPGKFKLLAKFIGKDGNNYYFIDTQLVIGN